MRTEQDKINRREANRRYYNLEENKEQKREYMRKYNKRTHKNLYPHHEQWAKENGYQYNDTLNSKNSVSFKDGAER